MRVNSTSNGATANGNGAVPPQAGTAAAPAVPKLYREPFDKSVILRQSPIWSRLLLWSIVGVTTAAIAWACLAKIEEAIPAQGKLEPEGAVQPVQAPVGGVVSEIHVEEGDRVEPGTVLVSFDQTAAQAQLDSLEEIREKLRQENQFYRATLEGTLAPEDENLLPLPTEIIQLTRNREVLIAENALYRIQLQGGGIGDLSADQRARLETSQAETRSRLSVAALEIDQLSRQLEQNSIQLANAREDLALNQNILSRLSELFERGGTAELQVLNQEQEVKNRLTQVNNLEQEEQRLLVAISQAREQLANEGAGVNEELQDRIAVNNNQIAQIDSQLTKQILENDKQLEEISSQIRQSQQTLSYQELRAPVEGRVFNLAANKPGYVANSTEPILEIVPEETLVARVFINNRDIGFVELDQKVDVRIDAFPYSEFGDVEGTLIGIGSDALPPDETFQFFRFPAEIALDAQSLGKVGDKPLALQTGMSVSANIKLRKRRVITLLSDLFVRKVDSLQSGG
ncbi:MAG: HlyD family efflux transporter periplasmic adaptor subunit [Cyanobacteria bacterium P01_A01_bin.123]